jgi:hypothetical protein
MAEGNPSATVSNAMYDIAGVNNMSTFRNLFTYNYPASTIGVRVRSTAATAAVEGPLNIENVWSGGNYLTGQRPCVAESGGNSLFSINWIGGVCNHPASAGAMMEINGHAGTGAAASGFNILGTYFENLQNGGGEAMKLADAGGIHISATVFGIRDTDNAVDISQTVAHHTVAIKYGVCDCVFAHKRRWIRQQPHYGGEVPIFWRVGVHSLL